MRPYRIPRCLSRFLSGLKVLFKRQRQDGVRQWSYPVAYQCDEYLSGIQLLDPSEHLVSIGDLCARLGEQLPIQIVKLVARDILEALAYMHDIRGFAHNAIAHECILLSQTDMNTLMSIYSDDQSTNSSFSLTETSGTNSPLDVNSLFDTSVPIFVLSAVNSEKVSYEHRCAMRPPEAILDAPCDESVDIWSLGCMLYQLLTGESLFDPLFQTVEYGLTAEESHLIQMIEMLGGFPLDLLSNGKNTSRWFTPDGLLRVETTYFSVNLEEILRMHIDAPEVHIVADFLRRLLRLRPQERAKARDLIDHPWLRGCRSFSH